MPTMKKCNGCGKEFTFTEENKPHGNHLNSSLKCKKYYDDAGDKKLTAVTKIEKVEAKKSVEDKDEVKKDTSYKSTDGNNNEKACEGCGQKITFTKENVPHGNHLGANIQCEKFYLKQKKAQLLQQLIDKIQSLKLLMKNQFSFICPYFRNSLDTLDRQSLLFTLL